MRLRLLIDVLWDESQIPVMQELVDKQVGVFVTLPDMPMPNEIGGRLMGAMPVEATEE